MSEHADQTKRIQDSELIAGLVSLQDRSANLAAGWLQGGWSDQDLPEMMTSGLVPIVLECADHVDQYACATPTWFRDAWERILVSVKRLGLASEASPDAIQPVLLLLPLTIDALLSEALGGDLKVVGEVKTVAPEFIESLVEKAVSLGEECHGDLEELIDALEDRSSHLASID